MILLQEFELFFGRMAGGGRTDRCGSRNSYLDVPWLCLGSSGMKGINKACQNSKAWDETGQTYEQTDFFSENILMEKSFWIYTKLIIERLILGFKYEKITKFSLNYRVITIIEARCKGIGRKGERGREASGFIKKYL